MNEPVTALVKKMVLHAPAIVSQVKPGQFVHVKAAGNSHLLLRRPLSIADCNQERGTLTLIYRIVGSGTAQLAALNPGEFIDCMGPLGSGFTIQGEKPLLVGGGMGIAPLVLLGRALCPRPIEVLIGGRTQEDMFWPDLFNDICHGLHITTDDGSLGHRGTTVNLLPAILKQQKIDMIYTCGPRVMMEHVAKVAMQAGIPCQVSLEEHMACGVGACLSCTCAGMDGVRRKICSDGPVFWAEEVLAL
jgi:dihydroorotate dehydrogenase electron transfer subunit